MQPARVQKPVMLAKTVSIVNFAPKMVVHVVYANNLRPFLGFWRILSAIKSVQLSNESYVEKYLSKYIL